MATLLIDQPSARTQGLIMERAVFSAETEKFDENLEKSDSLDDCTVWGILPCCGCRDGGSATGTAGTGRGDGRS